MLHGGIATPLHWNTKIFPRLILLSMAELPDFVGFRASLLAAAVISHVETGILLTQNSWVFPGIDHFFGATEREVTEAYPYPLMPVHHFNKVKHDESYRKHLCSPRQGCIAPMRWNHLGVLCWARSALPFLAAVLRSLLRDETYEVNAVRSQRVPLRVRRTADLETLMNVALWKAGAYKQWCKMHVSEADVERWLELPGNSSDCGNRSVCNPATNDTIFYPWGVPKVVVSSATSKVPRARAFLSAVEERYRRGDLPNPILFQKTYRNETEAKKDWPQINCLLGL